MTRATRPFLYDAKRKILTLREYYYNYLTLSRVPVSNPVYLIL